MKIGPPQRKPKVFRRKNRREFTVQSGKGNIVNLIGIVIHTIRTFQTKSGRRMSSIKNLPIFLSTEAKTTFVQFSLTILFGLTEHFIDEVFAQE